jgi:hypothetical protein
MVIRKGKGVTWINEELLIFMVSVSLIRIKVASFISSQ